MFSNSLARLNLNRSKKQFLILCILAVICTVTWWASVRLDGSYGISLDYLILGRNISNFNIHGENEESGDVRQAWIRGFDVIGNNDIDFSENDGGNKTIILMWSKYYHIKPEDLLENIFIGRRYDPSCCEGVEIATDRSKLENASAVVIFHYFGNLEKKDLPPTRRPDQLWVLFSKESPIHAPGLGGFNGLFNWTMSYRRDSEIWAPYGEYVELPEEEKPKEGEEVQVANISLTEWIAGKSKLLTGVISHCPTQSKREQFIKKLRSDGDIPVDIYGNCGNLKTCPRSNKKCDHGKFWANLGVQYKFYFAAENAFCAEYITEKFWRGLELGMVPVAYGKGNYSALAPPGSFIDTKDFQSTKDLAEYLLYLDRTPEEYRKFFEWRRKFQVRKDECWQGWCGLCKAVKEFKEKVDMDPTQLPQLSHVYRDFGGWWSHAPGKDNNPDVYNKQAGACSKSKF